MPSSFLSQATRIEIPRLQLRADQRGYVVDGRSVDGFSDDPGLSPANRRRIASWAQALGHKVTDAQRQLLTVPAPEDPVGMEVLTAATRNLDVDLELAGQFGLYDRLTADELQLVREPWQGIASKERRDYPLSAGELAELTGVTTKQVRVWESATLLPGARIDGRRQFFSAAVIHAFALKRMNRQQIAALTHLTTNDDDVFACLLEHTLTVRRRHLGKPETVDDAVAKLKDRVREILRGIDVSEAKAPAPAPSPSVLESLLRQALAQTSPVLEAVEAATSEFEDVQLIFDAGVTSGLSVKGPSDVKPRPRTKSHTEIRFPGTAHIIVHPASGKGWKFSADLGLEVPRKNDAVRIGKAMSEQIGGAFHVVSKETWTDQLSALPYGRPRRTNRPHQTGPLGRAATGPVR